MVEILQIAPQDIEAESFRIIEKELGPTSFPPDDFAVVRRCIHATGDFSFADNIRFQGDAVAAGIQAIQAGKNILIDVNMGASGISKGLLSTFGGQVICHINEPETAEMAKKNGTTRSDAAIERAMKENIGIVAVGNAPTALLKAMELVDQGLFAPDLIIGAPVGFVNAAESKELLAEKEYAHIVALGSKGGTLAAEAEVNARIRLAQNK